MARARRRVLRDLTPLLLVVLGVLPLGGCSCSPDPEPIPPPRGLLACRTHTPRRPGTSGGAPGTTTNTKTVSAGAIPATFSVSSTGEANFVMPLVSVPGRGGVEPQLSITYDSSAGTGDSILGYGFSLGGLSAVTRCPSNLAQDGEIRGVRYDAADKLCFEGRRLVAVGHEPGIIEYRTFPDTFVKVIGRYPKGGDAPEGALSFTAHLPSGLVIEYGTNDSGRPLADKNGASRAWLATKVHDGRGNAMTYSYCSAEDASGYTAEYALDEIRYTSFEGDPSLEPSRAVQFVYGTKDPADIRTPYAGGMQLQSSLRLDEIRMLGPEDTLVRRYGFTYGHGPTTNRTLLTQVEECTGDGVCKPPTRFQFSQSAAGFKQIATSLPTPTSKLASPMLADTDGDGRADLVVPDTDKSLSTPENPITQWSIAQNHGPLASPPYFSSLTLAFSEESTTVADPSGPADPALIQPEVGTAMDFDQDGRMDVFVHDVYGAHVKGQMLMARPNHKLVPHDTAIFRPFPLGVSPKPPTLTNAGGSIHLADLDGDGVPDMIRCEDHGESATDAPSLASWTVHLWKPSPPTGFDDINEVVRPLAGFRCDTALYTLDVNGDSKVDLLVQGMLTFGGAEKVPASTYSALSRRENGSWETFDTKLPIVAPGGRIVFLDVNGDGLPDAVASGFGDHALRTYLNTGTTFDPSPVDSLGSPGLGDQDTFFALAAPIDFNNDGRQDLLMPVPPGTLSGQPLTLPAWAILQASGGLGGPTFTLVDPHIPFEAALGRAITLADPLGPRVGDLNGDGAQDVLMALGGVFTVLENLAADQDLLIAVSDGMNAHDPTDPGFTPNVTVSYGHLTDDAITSGAEASDPAQESALYLSHADAKNDCAYPRVCAVGPRRVVSAYATNNGADSLRHFSVRYRDGRYHRLGRGFLGFGERILTDLDTGAGTADFYDNTTFVEGLNVFPFAGQVQHEWRWQPGLPSQPKPDQLELSFTDVTPTIVQTNGDTTYFTIPTERRMRRAQGVYASQGGSAPTVEAYVQQVASSGGATVLRDTTVKDADVDTFGNVRVEDVSTSGVDLTLHVERSFKNDTDRWVLGQLQTEKACSAAAMLAQCRMLTRTTTPYGEVETAATASDDGSPDTQLAVSYARDVFGNVTGVTADDAYGHHRASTTTYESEGVFPYEHINGAGHTTVTEFDAGLGVLTKLTDPNQLVTQRAYDGFGRLGLETRPDGTQTTVTLTRTKDGGPNQDAWRVTQRSTTTGGADDTAEYDSLGRPIRWWWYGPSPDARPRLMQEIAYDARGEHVARRSVPVSEGTPEGQLLFDVYDYDAVGREVAHTTPWNAVVRTTYDGLLVQVDDPLKSSTVAEQDPLGRPVTITDAAKGITAYTYGPFGALHTVTAPGGALTRMTRDAFGRVQKLDDPDRGTTFSAHDGFGELIFSMDALDRGITFGYDALGRNSSRLDKHGTESLTTTWTWDTAANGIGKLHTLASPEGKKTYAYNGFGELETLTLAVTGESEPLQARLDYDGLGRVAAITYPAPGGAAPFVVTQEYDAYGHMLAVRDSVTSLPYWRLTDVDSAGHFRKEVFGNGIETERSYYADKQSLAGIVTHLGATPVQDLSYDYDARGDLARRTDALQPQNWTERFRYDSLERLTCAYFSVTEDAAAPCALSYGYDPNGNLKSKSDVGTLSYGDLLHPHAVTGAGSDSFGYDAVGNQTTRPAGMKLTYTPFDLPKTIKQGASAITFAYDGDEQRIRKTTPVEETLYFEGFYERVTATGTAAEHQYYVHSPERVVAVVTRGGKQPGTRYTHVDHLGSVDALTDEGGAVVERRSYDPFGQRRNPVWGQPVPASFSSLTTQGFTGHESDDELGLVNMKGRMFDPKVGRFLTTDPIVSAPLSGQGWNPYSYVLGRPLSFVDPSGFEGIINPPGPSDITLPVLLVTPGPASQMDRYLMYIGPLPKSGEGPPQAEEVGAAVPPVDVSTTGNASGYVPQPVTTAQKADGTGGAPSWPWYEGVFHFNDRAKGWIAEDELDRRRSGEGGAPPALMGGSHPIAGSLPIVGLAVSVPSDTSAVPADVGAATASLSGLKVLTAIESAAVPVARAASSQLTADADALARAAPGVRDLPGYFTVVTHADANAAFLLRNGQWLQVSHRTLARFILGAGWQGERVFLVGCNAGACATGLAQNLANKLGVEVLAPQGEALLFGNGTVGSSVGDWVTFFPGGGH